LEHNPIETLALVIPVYNESQIISDVAKEWIGCLDKLNIKYDIHVYNDGSTDETLAILNTFKKDNNHLIIHDKNNSGHGPTILEGYRENSRYDWIFQTDSDNEMSPEYFQRLWKKRKDYDILLGRRSQRYQPFSRKLISLISRLTVRLFYGDGIWDVNSPFRLMRSSVLRQHSWSIPSNTFAPNVIVSGLMCFEKRRIFEIPIPHHGRQTGEVSIRNMKLYIGSCNSFIQTVMYRVKL